MSLVINHNLMAANSSNVLNRQYGMLAVSTQRLSTGLRINSAADDAAGLAIRELQRADVAALHQGTRNAQDAISLIQTADSALAVIDEKLIRMKELSEQAATGTYDSTQRQMIANEFEEMASEIDRIANATDFNGIKLLDGSLNGEHDGSGLNSSGALKVHFGSGNDSAEDYYYLNIDDCHVLSLIGPDDVWPNAEIKDGRYVFEVSHVTAGNWGQGLDKWDIPAGLKNVRIEAVNGTKINPPSNHKPHVNLFSSDGTQLTGYSPNNPQYNSAWWNKLTGEDIVKGAGFSPNAQFDDSKLVTAAGASVSHNGLTVNIITSQDESPDVTEIMEIEEVTDNLIFLIGGHSNNTCNVYDLKISCDIPYPKIDTQDKAQKMLKRLDNAIVKKDNIRAHLGAMQNRLENTITNLTTQAGNLEASQRRISDTNVAEEMTTFVRSQVLTQATVAMLAQANSLPQMAMRLMGG